MSAPYLLGEYAQSEPIVPGLLPRSLYHCYAGEIEELTASFALFTQVQLELPHHRSLRTVIDRMKGIDKFLYVDADMGGQLVFR